MTGRLSPGLSMKPQPCKSKYVLFTDIWYLSSYSALLRGPGAATGRTTAIHIHRRQASSVLMVCYWYLLVQPSRLLGSATSSSRAHKARSFIPSSQQSIFAPHSRSSLDDAHLPELGGDVDHAPEPRHRPDGGDLRLAVAHLATRPYPNLRGREHQRQVRGR